MRGDEGGTVDPAGRRPGAGPDRRRQREPAGSGRAHRAQQRLRHLREAVPVRRGDEVLRAPLRQLPGFGVGQGGAVERLAQPLPLLRVRPGGQGLPDRRAGSEVRAVRAPQGGARPGGVDARQRPAVHARRGSLQEVLGGGVRQAAGQRPGLLLRVQRLREGERHRPVQQLPQGLHQEVRQAAGGGRVRRPGVHEAGRDGRALEQEQERGARRLQARARRVHPAQAAGRRRRPRASPPRPTS